MNPSVRGAILGAVVGIFCFHNIAKDVYKTPKKNVLEKKQYQVMTLKYVDDMEVRRGPFRPDHLKHLEALRAQGKLVNAGPFIAPVDGGLQIYHGCTLEQVEAIAKRDPYVTAGLVTGYTVRTLDVVL